MRTVFLLTALTALTGLSALLPAPLSATPAARENASSALRLLEEAHGKTAVSHIVSIFGFDGQHQPSEWRILTRDLRSEVFLHEFIVKDGLVFGPRRVDKPPHHELPSRPLDTEGASIAVDSDRVFAICDERAAESGIGFDRITYQLQWRGDEAEPSWLASLVDEHRNLIVGHVFVLSGSGQVAHEQFFPPVRPIPTDLRPVAGVPPSAPPSRPATREVKTRDPVRPALRHRYGARDAAPR